MRFDKLASKENRWIALVVIALGLGIVIIDNTVLNVSIPYMLRDLNTSLNSIEWVISGYALTIATILITVGRLGDLFGRKRIFKYGVIIFMIGSFIASIGASAWVVIVGRSIIQAVGAAMVLTSALSLLAAEFEGKERAIAFGVWGAVAGASASVGPLLGGYLTTYFSWRWSLRINVVVGIIALLGSFFIIESKSSEKLRFDWQGTILSAIGLFSLVFAFIESRNLGWWTPTDTLKSYGWPLQVSVVPFMLLFAAIFLAIFLFVERRLEKQKKAPLLQMSLFRRRGFTVGLTTLAILALGQFGTFFILPIYFQNV